MPAGAESIRLRCLLGVFFGSAVVRQPSFVLFDGVHMARSSPLPGTHTIDAACVKICGSWTILLVPWLQAGKGCIHSTCTLIYRAEAKHAVPSCTYPLPDILSLVQIASTSSSWQNLQERLTMPSVPSARNSLACGHAGPYHLWCACRFMPA